MHRALHLSLGWNTASASPVQHRDLRVLQHSRDLGHASVSRSWACGGTLRSSHAAFIKQKPASQCWLHQFCFQLHTWGKLGMAGGCWESFTQRLSHCLHVSCVFVALQDDSGYTKECPALQGVPGTAEWALAGASFQLLEMNTAQWGCSGMGMDQNVPWVRKPPSPELLLCQCIQILTNPCGVV